MTSSHFSLKLFCLGSMICVLCSTWAYPDKADHELPVFLAGEPLKIAPSEGGVQRLRKEQHNAALKETQSRFMEFLAGRGTPDLMVEAAGRLRSSRLALSRDQGERLEVCRQYLGWTQRVETIQKKNMEDGRIPNKEYDYARYVRLDAEVDLLLLQEKSGNTDPKSKQGTVKIPSQREGVIVFIGAEIKEGEKVPPERLITVNIGGEQKKYQRLRVGERIVEGQMLAQVDDRLARGDVAIKASKVRASKADLGVAEAALAEASARYETGKKLRERGVGIPKEELDERQFAAERFRFEVASKKEAVVQAEIELTQAQTVVELHQIRSRVAGIVKAIYKHPGEAARMLETILEIQVIAKD